MLYLDRFDAGRKNLSEHQFELAIVNFIALDMTRFGRFRAFQNNGCKKSMTQCLLDDQERSEEDPQFVRRMIEAPIGNCSDTKKAQMAEFYNSRFPADYVESINLIDNAQCIDTSGL